MNRNIIVEESSSTMRALARQALTGRWAEAIIFTLALNFILLVPDMAFSAIHTENQFISGLVNGLSLAYDWTVGSGVTLAMTAYFLMVFRRRPGNIEAISYASKYLPKAVVMAILIRIQVILLSFLFVIPGIIAIFKLSQSFYILADDPEKPISQCMFESKQMMSGNKMKLFLLELSFMGWQILASIPAMIAQNATGDLPIWEYTVSHYMNGDIHLTLLTTILLNTIPVLVTIYMNTAESCFYDLACGNLQIRSAEEAAA